MPSLSTNEVTTVVPGVIGNVVEVVPVIVSEQCLL